MNDVLKITTSRYGMKEIHFKSDSEFGIRLNRQIQSVDDGTKFLTADEFMSKFGYLLDRKVDDVVSPAEGEDSNERYLMVDKERFEEFLKRYSPENFLPVEKVAGMSLIEQFNAIGMPMTDEVVSKARQIAKLHYGNEPVVRPSGDKEALLKEAIEWHLNNPPDQDSDEIIGPCSLSEFRKRMSEGIVGKTIMGEADGQFGFCKTKESYDELCRILEHDEGNPNAKGQCV